MDAHRGVGMKIVIDLNAELRYRFAVVVVSLSEHPFLLPGNSTRLYTLRRMLVFNLAQEVKKEIK